MKQDTSVLIENAKNEVVMLLATIDSERFLEYFMRESHDQKTKDLAIELVKRSKQSNVIADTNYIIQQLRRELENDRNNI